MIESDVRIRQPTTVLMALLFVLIFSHAEAQRSSVEIREPKSQAKVCQQQAVRGSVSSRDLQVYVLVHPVATANYWVQALPEPAENWQIYAYFGEPSKGLGESFEILAVASPKKALFKRGDMLPFPLGDHPEIVARSKIATVVREDCAQR